MARLKLCDIFFASSVAASVVLTRGPITALQRVPAAVALLAVASFIGAGVGKRLGAFWIYYAGHGAWHVFSALVVVLALEPPCD